MTTTYEWATTEAPCKIELSNTCSCGYCNACECVYTGVDLCTDCGGDLAALDWCDGDCWDYILEDLKDNIFPEWLTRAGSPEYLRVEGRRMGWQGLNGYAVTRASFDEVMEKLSLRGEWTLRFTLADDVLTVGRYSHDEPMGAHFTIAPDTSAICGDCLIPVADCAHDL